MVRAADNDGDPGELCDAGDVRALSCREGARLRQKLPDTQGKIKGIVNQEQKKKRDTAGHNRGGGRHCHKPEAEFMNVQFR